MRTTLDIHDELLLEARRRAAERGTTLTAFIEEALAAALARAESERPAFKLDWRPHQGRYIGGVDLADRDALCHVMEDAS